MEGHRAEASPPRRYWRPNRRAGSKPTSLRRASPRICDRSPAGTIDRHSGCQNLETRIVVNDDIGPAELALAGPLGGLARLQNLRSPAATAGHAMEPDRLRGINESQQVAEIVPAGLEQDGRVQHDRRGVASYRLTIDDRLELLPHLRMDDRFQIVERRPGGEDDRAQGLPIDRAKGGSGVRPVRNHQVRQIARSPGGEPRVARAPHGPHGRRRSRPPPVRPAAPRPGSCRRQSRRSNRSRGPLRVSTGRATKPTKRRRNRTTTWYSCRQPSGTTRVARAGSVSVSTGRTTQTAGSHRSMNCAWLIK